MRHAAERGGVWAVAHTCEDECSVCRKINYGGTPRAARYADSTFLRHTYAPRKVSTYTDERGKAEAGLRSEAALRALGDDRDMTEEQLAPLARVHGDAADRAVVDGRRGHGRSLEKVPGKLGRVERGAPEVIVPGNRRLWELLTDVKWVS